MREMMYIALFAAVTAVLGLLPPIPLPFIPVPITAQTLGVMLAGSILGARMGGMSLLVFVILVAMGAPLLSGGRGGLAVVVSPTGGYFLSFPVAAFAIGVIAKRFATAGFAAWKLLLANVIGGIAVVYAIGSLHLSFVTEVPIDKALLGNAAFLPGDLLKAVMASLIAARIHKIYPAKRWGAKD